MKPTQALSAIVIALIVSGCQTIDEQATLTIGQAEIQRMDGSYAGQAVLYRSAKELTVNIALSGFAAGEIDLIFHESSSCPITSNNGVFIAALPSARVGENGTLTVSSWLQGAPDQLLGQLLDSNGTALAIFQGGKSNAPLACGVFSKK